MATFRGNKKGNFLEGTDGDDSIFGKRGKDTLYGKDGNDHLDGGNGADLMYGGGGKDYFIGGLGNDKMYGDAGDDLLDAGDGKDLLYGGEGDDTLDGNLGDDFIFGGAGKDSIGGGPRGVLDVLYGGADEDHFIFIEISKQANIEDFQDNLDLIIITKAIYSDLKQIFDGVHARSYGGDTYIDLAGDGSYSRQIVVKHVADYNALRDDLILT